LKLRTLGLFLIRAMRLGQKNSGGKVVFTSGVGRKGKRKRNNLVRGPPPRESRPRIIGNERSHELGDLKQNAVREGGVAGGGLYRTKK